jgi:hypothetical protein
MSRPTCVLDISSLSKATQRGDDLAPYNRIPVRIWCEFVRDDGGNLARYGNPIQRGLVCTQCIGSMFREGL